MSSASQRRQANWLAAAAPHPVAGWAPGQVVYVREGALIDFPALYQRMVTRRRALVVTGLFQESVATIDISKLENA
jgi:hypothetical protein